MPNASFEPPRRVLMGPGPSDVHERVLNAMARPTIGHLDPAFVRLMDDIKDLLRYVFRTENTLTMPVSGPGTAGMESCVVNVVEPGTRILIAQNGVFGARLSDMARRAGADVLVVESEWGRAVSPEKLEAALAANPGVEVVGFVQAETSTGALSDAQTLARIAHDHGALALVDTVTALGGVPVEVDAWGLDVVYSGTQKCLSAPPGLSPITLNDRAAERVRNRRTPVQSWFMDLNLVMAYWGGGKRSYHHTAPVNALYGLHEALLMVKEEGIENAWARHRRNHQALRAGLETMGMRFIVPEEERLPELNAVSVPEGVDEAKVRGRLLEEHGLEIGAGLGALAGRIWRIGLMGYASRPENVMLCVRALGTVLADEGVQVDVDGAAQAAESALAASAV